MANDQWGNDLPEWEMESMARAEQLANAVKLTDEVDVQLDLPVVEPEPLPPSAYTEQQGVWCIGKHGHNTRQPLQALSKQT